MYPRLEMRRHRRFGSLSEYRQWLSKICINILNTVFLYLWKVCDNYKNNIPNAKCFHNHKNTTWWPSLGAGSLNYVIITQHVGRSMNIILCAHPGAMWDLCANSGQYWQASSEYMFICYPRGVIHHQKSWWARNWSAMTTSPVAATKPELPGAEEGAF